jgi:hypothetical protein
VIIRLIGHVVILEIDAESFDFVLYWKCMLDCFGLDYQLLKVNFDIIILQWRIINNISA